MHYLRIRIWSCSWGSGCGYCGRNFFWTIACRLGLPCMRRRQGRFWKRV